MEEIPSEGEEKIVSPPPLFVSAGRSFLLPPGQLRGNSSL